MAYCTIEDVKAQNPKRTYSADSTPRQSQVEEFIVQTGSEIDSVLSGRGLAVPATAPAEFVSWLLLLNACGAAAYAETAMFPEAGGIGSSPHGAQLYKMYRDGLERLRNDALPSSLDGRAWPMSFFERHGADEAEPSSDYDWQRPKFGKNKEF